ncbi:MAG: FAD-dependent oxidoreductase, partial [Rhodobacteraceae bacterium]|nr:FAD-dependent oxidoreductase [Paracoccaceae bacterium]
KTFMWPKAFWEKLYEPIIRHSAGLGKLSLQEDPDIYDKGFLHCDLLIIGAGPAGLSAALAAGRSGAQVILADEDFLLGGRLNAETYAVDGMPGYEWAKAVLAELASLDNVQVMNRTTIYGAYDHGIFGALERCTDHLASADGKPRQILWRIYSKRSILAAGSTERPIAFGMNDRPGIMLAGAVRTYVNRYGVAPGKQVAIFTNNDDGWHTATDLAAQGVTITAVIDSRDIAAPVGLAGAETVMGGRIVTTSGRKGVRSLTLSNGRKISADCIAVSGGWSPNVHLTCHQRGRPVWRDDIAAFVPGTHLPPGMSVAGAANGAMTLGAAMREGHETANALLADLGFTASNKAAAIADEEAADVSAFWHVVESKGRAWLDLQNDVTVKDIRLAYKEGFKSVEHLKRYTTLGMATDQGKTANIPALAIMAECTGKTIPETGTTIFRPPYTPIPIAALAGRARGKEFRPYRLTPSHKWAAENGATFVEVGNWMRAQWYARQGELGWRDSVDREVEMTRKSVGICDVTTLGKIDIQGRDAAEFLNNIYTNAFLKLPVGKVRYGLMLREDGIAYDDGTTARLGENHFVMTTTTANAVLVFRRMEFARQCLYPGLDVHLISVTDAWAQFAVAGPNSRKLMQKVLPDRTDISNGAFPFMACCETKVFGGTPARLFRISFSGEMAYEIAVPARFGNSMMAALMQAGEEFDAVPYGTEALGVMRIEKGHAAGNELNGQTTAVNLGLGGFVSQKKDCIGKILSERPEMNRTDAIRLVGFRPVDRDKLLIAGSQFIAKQQQANMENSQGWMSSVAYSPTLGHSIGLGFIARGHERMGEIVQAVSPARGGDMDVEIVSPHFIDPQGGRQRG